VHIFYAHTLINRETPTHSPQTHVLTHRLWTRAHFVCTHSHTAHTHTHTNEAPQILMSLFLLNEVDAPRVNFKALPCRLFIQNPMKNKKITMDLGNQIATIMSGLA